MELIKQQHDVSQWVADYSDSLFRYAYQRLHDREDANDLVQDTFLAAWRSIDSYDERSSVKTWLFVILKNKLTDHYRKVAHRSSDRLIQEATDPFFDEADHWKAGSWPKEWPANSEHSMDNKEFYSVLNVCTKKLNKLAGTAFTLKYVEGMNSEEICKLLQVSSSHYWVLLHRAKVQLRACLEKNWFIP